MKTTCKSAIDPLYTIFIFKLFILNPTLSFTYLYGFGFVLQEFGFVYHDSI